MKLFTNRPIASLLVFSCCLTTPALASDVLVSADFNVGQGFNYLVDDQCYVLTPNHVMGTATSANVMLPTRQYHTADVTHVFDVDMAILKADIPAAQCNRNTFLQVSDLNKLLGVYQNGVLKTRLADGSVLQTKIVISAVDDSEFLAIKPERADEPFKQGYSGSILFVAEQAAGVLLEVDDAGGIVYRADALTAMLNEHFDISSNEEASENTPDNAAEDDAETTTNSHLTGRLATNQIKDYSVKMQENSPVEFVLTGVEANEVKFAIQILDKRENELFDDDFWSNNNYNFAFTPPRTDEFTVRLVGLQAFGEFDVKMNDFSFDAELRGAGNQLEIPDNISVKLAPNAVSEYQFHGEANSPIEFTLNEVTGNEFKYAIHIIDGEGNALYKDDFWSNNNYTFAFTPQQNGEYTIRLIGIQRYGQTDINVSQWNTNAALTGAQNVVAAGDIVTNKIADNAVAEYRMMMTANAPIDFKLESQSPNTKFLIELVDETGEVRYSDDFWSRNNSRFVFTPLSSDVHVIRITGLQRHGTFYFKLFDYD